MKRLFMWMLLLIVCISMVATLSLAGCKTEAEEVTAPAEEEAAEEVEEEAAEEVEAPTIELEGEISFWVYEPVAEGLAVLDDLKAKFEQQYPGTTIDILPVPKDGFNTKLNTAIASGDAPDASYLDQPLVALFVRDGIIDQVPDGLINEDDLYSGALNTNRVDNKLYGLPLSQTTVALYYNTDLVPTPPETWDELIEISQNVYDPDNEIAAFNVPQGDGWGAWLFPGFVATAGGTMLDESNKEVTFAEAPAVDALSLWVELLQYSPIEISTAQNAFQTGHVAMMISGPWELGGLRTNWPELNWDVALIPKNVQWGSNIGGDNAVVYKDSENKDLAWAWIKFLTEAENNLELSIDVMGNFPINLALATGDWLNDDLQLQTFMEQMKYAQARPTVTDWLKINDELISRAIGEALAGTKTPEQALSDAADDARQILGW